MISGFACAKSANTPATCGLAILVPLYGSNLSLFWLRGSLNLVPICAPEPSRIAELVIPTALIILVPGAVIVITLPRLLDPARYSKASWLAFATVIVLEVWTPVRLE